MDARDQARVLLARRVARLLRLPDFRAMLPVRDEAADAAPIVVAFADDTVGYVHDRAVSLGGDANVVVETAPDRFAVIAVEKAGDPDDGVDEAADIRESTEIGMLLALLREVRRGVHIRFVGPDLVAELVGDGDGASPLVRG